MRTNLKHSAMFCLAALCVTLLCALGASGAAADTSSYDLSSRIQQNQAEIQKLQAQVDELDLRMNTERKTQERNQVELADANSRVRDAEDQYNATLKLYEDRITAIYKLDQGRMVSAILDSESLADAVSRVQYLSTIGENDRRLVLQVKAEAQTVRELHDRIDQLKQSKAGDIRALESQRNDLQNRIRTFQANIDSDTSELLKAQARERDEETRRLAEEAQSDFLPAGGPLFPGSGQPPPNLRPTGIVFSGTSSWYGPGFHGNRTANGEIYNMYAYTAAHKTLPFGTWLKVTYRGLSVFVRINDRGPYVGARMLDLSYASAQSIGLTGVGYVTCEIYR